MLSTNQILLDLLGKCFLPGEGRNSGTLLGNSGYQQHQWKSEAGYNYVAEQQLD